jgi:hypothetical protein
VPSWARAWARAPAVVPVEDVVWVSVMAGSFCREAFLSLDRYATRAGFPPGSAPVSAV